MRIAVFVSLIAMSIAGTACAQPPVTGGTYAAGVYATGVPDGNITRDDYQLGPLDKISVRVFGEEKLSVEKVQVDASGIIVLPLIGAVRAGGKTASQLSADVAARLGERYLQSPQVSVSIDEAVSQRVTVTGAVVEAGVYSLKGKTTLLQALAMAKGPDMKIANLHQVAIFRRIDGKNARAVFDVKAINEGKSDDPEVLGGDSVIVDSSRTKTAWRELVGVLPGLGIFSYF